MKAVSEFTKEDRREDIINLLEDGETVVTKAELAERYNVSKDTIYNDMEALGFEEGGAYPIVKDREGMERAYSFQFAMEYRDEPELVTADSDIQEVVDYYTAEALGLNDRLGQQKLEDREKVKVDIVGEPVTATKLYNHDLWVGKAEKMKELKKEKGEDYFDENYVMVINGSLLPHIPFFYSKVEKNQAMQRVGYWMDKDTSGTAADILQDEGAILKLVNKELSGLEDYSDIADSEYDTPAEFWVDRVIEGEEGGDELQEMQGFFSEKDILEELDPEVIKYIKHVKDRLSDDLDPEKIAKKITTHEQAVQSIARTFKEIKDVIGYDVPLIICDGEEGRKNKEAIKEIKVQDYSEEVRATAQEISNKIETMYDELVSFRGTIREMSRREDSDRNYDVLLERLEDMEARDLVDVDFHDFDIEEGIENYEELLEAQEEFHEGIKRLNRKLRGDEKQLSAMLVEKAVTDAFGKAGAKIFNRISIEADANEILESMADIEYKELLYNIPGTDVIDIVDDKDLGHIEIGGWDIEYAHNLRQASDIPVFNGLEKMAKQRVKMSDRTPDLFISGHHGPMAGKYYKLKRGPSADVVYQVQAGVFQDPEKVQEFKGDGQKDMNTKRFDKGMFGSGNCIVELEVKEGPEGELRKTRNTIPWQAESLKNLGRQVQGTNFVKDLKDINWMDFEVWSDEHFGSPHDVRYAFQKSIQELSSEFIEWQRKHGPDNKHILELGDVHQGSNIYRHQTNEVEVLKGRDWERLVENVQRQLEEAGADKDTIIKSIKELGNMNANQSATSSMSRQTKAIKRNLISPWQEDIYQGIIEEITHVSGDHYDNNMKNRNLDEAIDMQVMYNNDTWEEKVNTVTMGGKYGRGFMRVGDRTILLSHESEGKGRHKIRSMYDDPAVKGENVDCSASGNKHVGAWTIHNGKFHFSSPGLQPTTDLGHKIGRGDIVRGIISNLRMPEDPDKGFYEIEYLVE
ncbi:MAG: HTH domain-containing protein [Candidatus Nanohaloarchaea archaeon]|nr:HTH domain-containing protein [Candidatus Nanohaloarchaea archaeon]